MFIKGGPEPLEKEIHEILGSKCEDRFSDPFFDWVQNPAEVPEDSRVLRVRRLWFPTSNHLETWLIPSGTTRSRQYHESTMF